MLQLGNRDEEEAEEGKEMQSFQQPFGGADGGRSEGDGSPSGHFTAARASPSIEPIVTAEYSRTRSTAMA